MSAGNSEWSSIVEKSRQMVATIRKELEQPVEVFPTPALGWWLWYPLTVELLRGFDHPESKEISRELHPMREEADSCMLMSAEHLMQFAEGNRIDSGSLWLGARLAIRLYGARAKDRRRFFPEDRFCDTWPASLGSSIYLLQSADQITASACEAIIARISVICPDPPIPVADSANTSKLPQTPPDAGLNALVVQLGVTVHIGRRRLSRDGFPAGAGPFPDKQSWPLVQHILKAGADGCSTISLSEMFKTDPAAIHQAIGDLRRLLSPIGLTITTAHGGKPYRITTCDSQ